MCQATMLTSTCKLVPFFFTITLGSVDTVFWCVGCIRGQNKFHTGQRSLLILIFVYHFVFVIVSIP